MLRPLAGCVAHYVGALPKTPQRSSEPWAHCSVSTQLHLLLTWTLPIPRGSGCIADDIVLWAQKPFAWEQAPYFRCKIVPCFVQVHNT